MNPPRLFGEGADFAFDLTRDSLKSIYFRAPVYLRDIYQPTLTPDQQLQRTQWAAFLRALTVFDTVFWVNHPRATYQAEVKPFQLFRAQQVGFDIPSTVITNDVGYCSSLSKDRGKLIVKTLDPAILNTGEHEAFVYTNTVSISELADSHLASAPVVIQEELFPKIDIRVTVVRSKVFAVTITRNGQGIEGDWRKTARKEIKYDPIDLPSGVLERCQKLTKALELQFGAIDLALCRNKYYFLEINPTGEWAWLVDTTSLKIDEEIATALIEGQGV